MTLEPRAGIKMPHVDALSRYPVAMITADECHVSVAPQEADDSDQTLSEKVGTMSWLQRQDPECRNVHSAIKRGTKVHAHLARYIKEGQLVVEDNVIYHKNEQRKVPFAPVALRQRLLFEYHGGSCAAHLGSKKVLGALRRKYFWPSMHHDVFEYVNGCALCLRRKGRPIEQGKMVSLPKGTPFQVVASDIFGPLPATQRGNKFILVFIDHFTKWPVIIPAPAITAEHFVKYFHDYWVTQFGCPRRLLTDGGPQFVADITREFCSKYNIDKTVSTAYHPQSNGVAEAFMKVLGHSLSILTKYRAANWDLYCSTVAFAYRTAIHPGTNNTPAYLTFGFDPKLPVDCDVVEDTRNEDTGERLRQLAIWRKVAKARLQVEPDANTLRRTTRIRPGMLVVYKLNVQEAKETTAHKLLPRFSTPWRVIRQLNNSVTYEIRNVERGETKLINRDRLAIYTPNTGQYSLYEAQALPRPLATSAEMSTPELVDAPKAAEVRPPVQTPQSVLPQPVAPQRQLRATVEQQSRAGDPMSW